MTDYWDAITNLPLHIGYLLWCPIYQVIGVIIHIINLFYQPMAMLLNAFINLGNDFIEFNSIILLNMFPSPIAILLILGIGVVVGLRIWSFLSKISILGNKIG